MAILFGIFTSVGGDPLGTPGEEVVVHVGRVGVHFRSAEGITPAFRASHLLRSRPDRSFPLYATDEFPARPAWTCDLPFGAITSIRLSQATPPSSRYRLRVALTAAMGVILAVAGFGTMRRPSAAGPDDHPQLLIEAATGDGPVLLRLGSRRWSAMHWLQKEGLAAKRGDTRRITRRALDESLPAGPPAWQRALTFLGRCLTAAAWAIGWIITVLFVIVMGVGGVLLLLRLPGRI